MKKNTTEPLCCYNLWNFPVGEDGLPFTSWDSLLCIRFELLLPAKHAEWNLFLWDDSFFAELMDAGRILPELCL